MTCVLPTGWEEKTLGEVCEIERGGSPRPIKNYITTAPDGLNWIKIGDTDPNGKYIYHVKEKIRPEGLSKSRWVEEDDFLLSNSMSYGRPYILKTNGCIHDGWLVLRKYQAHLQKDFLYYLLSSPYVQAQFKESAQGSTVSNLNTQRVAKVHIPIPPLPEQKRIVEKLDKIFANIDKAKENTTKNLQNAKEVFDSFLDNVFTEKSASWTQKALGDILSKEKYSMKRGPFGSALRKSFFVPQGIRVFEQYNPINNDPHWKRYFISQEKYKELEAFTAQAGDLLVSCSGSLGKIVELPQNTETGIINQALLKIKLEQTLILNSFFIYWFRSPHVQTLIREKTNGVAIPNLIAVKELKKIKVPVPSRSIQEQIVKKLNFLRAKTQELEQIYTKKLADLDELKQSVLQQAFSGKL